MISGYHQQVADHYERYPYPSYSFYSWGSWSQLQQVDLAHWGVEGRVQNAWIVGCGTLGPLMFGRRNPRVSFFASDLSRNSLRQLRIRLGLFGIHNVDLAHEDLMETSYSEAFDVIDCYGVLHHCVSPALALKKLASALRKGGILRLMLYSRSARSKIESLRSELLEKKLTRIDQIRFFLREKNISQVGDLSSTSGIADAILNPIVHTYDDEALQTLLQEVPSLQEMRRSSLTNYVLFLKKI